MKLKYAYDELAWVISEACELRPLFFENGQSGNRIADDQLRRNQDLGISCFVVGDAFRQDFDGEDTDLFGRLADAGDGWIEIIEVGVVVEGDDRYVLGNAEARLADGFNGSQQDRVTEREDRRRD